MSDTPERDEDGFVMDTSVDVIDGRTGPSGATYAKFRQKRTIAWNATDSFCPEASKGYTELKNKGIKVYTGGEKAALLAKLAARVSYPSLPVGERVGWSEDLFCYPDGRVFPASVEDLPIAYSTRAVRVTAKGTLEEWQEQVANFIVGQHLPVFCLMVGFAAPLLSLTQIQGNYLIMLSGMPRKGKTTCIELMASLCGPVLDGPAGRYYLKFNNTMNRLEEWLFAYADLPMVIDELSSHGTKTSRLTDFRTFVHHLAGVHARGRMGDDLRPDQQARSLIAMTSNEGCRELLSYESPDAAAAVEDRVIEIPVSPGSEGAFNGLRPDSAAASRFALDLRERMGECYGTAMPAFLEAVTCHRRSDERNLIDGINRRIEEFVNLPEVVELGDASSRILRIFGLGFAAGLLAQYHGVLATELDCKAAAIHCLRLHLGHRSESDPVERILGFIGANDVHDLRGGSRSPLSDSAIKERGIFINERNGAAQLCIAPVLFRSSFPDAKALLGSLKLAGVLVTEPNGSGVRTTIKTPVCSSGRHARMHVLVPPDLEEWLELNGYPWPRIKRASRRQR